MVKKHWRSPSLPLNRFQRTHPHASSSCAFYQLVVYLSDYLRAKRSVLDHLSATVFTSGELG